MQPLVGRACAPVCLSLAMPLELEGDVSGNFAGEHACSPRVESNSDFHKIPPVLNVIKDFQDVPGTRSRSLCKASGLHLLYARYYFHNDT